MVLRIHGMDQVGVRFPIGPANKKPRQAWCFMWRTRCRSRRFFWCWGFQIGNKAIIHFPFFDSGAGGVSSCLAALPLSELFGGDLLACFFFQSPSAAFIASSARTEQWILIGGRASSCTISVFFILAASSMVRPFSHSVAKLELAMAEPQPKVLNFASSITSPKMFSIMRLWPLQAGQVEQFKHFPPTSFSVQLCGQSIHIWRWATITSETFICSFMTSPHSGAPTTPVPTLGSFLSSEPTLRGFL